MNNKLKSFNLMSPAFKAFLVLFAISSIFLISVLIFLIFNSNEKLELSNLNQDFFSSDYEFYFTPSKKWDEKGILKTGAQYDCKFINKTNRTLKKWEFVLKLPKNSYVVSAWNGVFYMFNENLHIMPQEHNAEILPGQKLSFGFISHSQELIERVDFSMSFYRVFKPFTSSLFVFAFSFWILFLILALFTFYSTFKFLQLKQLLDQTFNTVVNIVDSFDEYTYSHSRNVAFYSAELAKRMKLKRKDVFFIYYVALVHDIGKVAIMRDMLHKKDSFTEEERQIMKAHTIAGGEILKDFISIPQIKDGALYHHERFDGSGYPKGLEGEEIPLFARIICVADSFDVMASKRAYKEKLSVSDIIEELKICSGTQFDPVIAKYMIDMVNDGVAPLK
ncbi:HD domain-containing phosphohydrolase [Treponema pectinovorum]|uniref:HD domain-containing phosphohydrolase n=1 Tax=Treponema pectinovorum TaxID=164 RepID=UPI0011C9B35E|nr:HD domain-containing phosphohydrolase [Treponema pectinovorum]